MDIRMSQYILETSICLLVFYGAYFLMLKKNTFFQLNRCYLLFTALLALIIPLLNITFSLNTQDEMQWQAPIVNETIEYVVPSLNYIHTQEPEFWDPIEATPTVSIITLGSLLLSIYLLGVFIAIARLVKKLIRVQKIIKYNNRKIDTDYTLVSTTEIPTSSFMGFVFVNPLEKESDLILEHERVHIKQMHTLDVLFIELIVAALWFNPIMYWYRSRLKEVHEYIADEYVANKFSRLDYAKALITSQMNVAHPSLVNTFHSMIKNRLIMLSNKPSASWNYLKYLMVLPLMIGLVMLFSFNFAQQLPDEITQPIEEAGKLAENLKEANLFSSLQEGEKVSLEWGNYTCECFEDQVKGYYRCRSLELTTNALKNLMKKSEAFTLLKDETSTSYENVRVIINRTLKVRGTFTQLEEVPQEFKAALPFIKKSRSGDILSLVFDSKQGKEMYKFNIVLNNKNEEVAYDYMVKVGNQYFGIDMMNKEGIKYMTPETYEQIIDQPIEVIRNGKEVIPVKSISFGNSRTQIIENRDSYKLTDFIYGKRIVPGNRMEMKIVLEDDYRFDLTMILKKRKVDLSEEAELMEELEEPAPDLVFQWGDRAFSTKKMILLSTKELESLKDQPISFKFDGETQNVVDVEHMYSTENKNAYSKYKTYVVNELYSGEVEPRDWKEVFYELVAELESSSTLSLSSIRLKNGLFTGVFISVLDEMDWSELYLGDQSYEKYDEATGLVALQRPDLIDLEKLKNLKFFKNRPPYISVNGRPVFSSDRKDFFAEASFDNEDVIFVHIPKPGSHDVVGALGFGPGMSGLLEVRMKSNTFDKKILWTDVKADNPVPFKNLDEVNKKINDNISTFEIPTEARTPVQATQVGLVTKVVNESDDVRGRHIEVTHSDGGKTIYGQLGIIEVAKGDHIKKTTIIGLTGEKPFLYQIITSQEENRINYPQGYPVKLTAQSEVGADVSINSVRKSSDFGDRTHPIFQTIKFHTGVDFAGPQGTAVFATANGMVSQVDDVDAKKGFEKYVLIGHGGNIETFYGHIISDLKVGDEIKKGQQIGTIMKDHLHYELRKNGRAINPKSSFVELKK